eukprot:6780701-Pyramimonas_sp.AAC.1
MSNQACLFSKSLEITLPHLDKLSQPSFEHRAHAFSKHLKTPDNVCVCPPNTIVSKFNVLWWHWRAMHRCESSLMAVHDKGESKACKPSALPLT